MKKTIYICDHCGKECSQPHLNVPQFQLGVTTLDTATKINPFIKAPNLISLDMANFCNTDCLFDFIAAKVNAKWNESLDIFGAKEK